MRVRDIHWRSANPDGQATRRLFVGYIPTTEKLVFMWKRFLQAHINSQEFRALMEDPGELNVGWDCDSMFPAGGDFDHDNAAHWGILDYNPAYVCQPVNLDSRTTLGAETGDEYACRFALNGQSQIPSQNANIPAGSATVGCLDAYNDANPYDAAPPAVTDPWGNIISKQSKQLEYLYPAMELMQFPNEDINFTNVNYHIPDLQGGLDVACGLLRLTDGTQAGTFGWDDGFYNIGPDAEVSETGVLDVWVDGWDVF